MPDIIQLLPDSVANQIAAGEVIQRPASVIKELIENAVDAGADEISIQIKDAGKTLIQVIDNGVGMSDTDARMSFERHATSKIRNANDLFEIRTKGFRGEALASIASIAHVNLKSKKVSEDVGTQIQINGSKVEAQEPASCATGSIFTVKNLFFNVPARRKFLKSNTTEFKHIVNEFQRIALTHPDIEFNLFHNSQAIFQLRKTNLKQRIIHLFGKQMNQNLNNVETETPLLNIRGYIGKPEMARRTAGEQYFFVNNRYMRHPYFYRAVMRAYENLIPAGDYPSFFLYLDIEPTAIDINIHPTKTEIKFEDEQAIYQILHASIREALGKTNVAPSIDFDTHGVVNIPTLKSDTEIKAPEIPINYSFNPFNEPEQKPNKPSSANYEGSSKREVPENWDRLYADSPSQERLQVTIPGMVGGEEHTTVSTSNGGNIQIKSKYILISVKSGLMVIDQKRAHQRILYEQLIQSLALNQIASQKTLYPDKIDLHTNDYAAYGEIQDDLSAMGFEISDLGSNTIVINGLPSLLEVSDSKKLFETLLEEYRETKNSVGSSIKDKLAIAISCASAIPYGKSLTTIEMQSLVDDLFACENPNYSPVGKKCIAILKLEDLSDLLT